MANAAGQSKGSCQVKKQLSRGQKRNQQVIRIAVDKKNTLKQKSVWNSEVNPLFPVFYEPRCIYKLCQAR
jgi:hypothetical protein